MVRRKKNKIYKSMEEVIKAYMPENYKKVIVEKTDDAHHLGVLLARTDIKDVKNLLAQQNK